MKREILPALILLVLACLIGSQFFRHADTRSLQTLAATPTSIEDRMLAVGAGNQRVSAAAEKLFELPPLQARLRFKITLFDQLISGPGMYYQKGQGTRLSRIEFQFVAGEDSLRLNQLSNGEFLYNLTIAFGEPTLEYVDLRKLKSLPATRRKDLTSWLTVGSLPGLLRQLSLHFDFSTPVEDQLDGIPVTKMVGRWKPEALARMMEGQVDAAHFRDQIDWSELPIHLPHQVRITLGEGGPFPDFPYQIVFEQFQQHSGQLVAKPIVTLGLYELQSADDLSDEMFALPSIQGRPTDATDFYRQRILQFSR